MFRLSDIFLVMLFVAAAALAHQDALLDKSASGEVSGIPDKYGVVAIRINRDVKPVTVSVQIAQNKIELPPCVSQYFELPDLVSIRAIASWYHDLNDFPPYLAFELLQNQYESGEYDGYMVMFNLSTGEFIEVQDSVVEEIDGALMVRSGAIPLDSICTESEVRSLLRVSGK